MNPCPTCNGALQPATVTYPTTVANLWACENCRTVFERCFCCTAIASQGDSVVHCCLNRDCPVYSRPYGRCPRCGKWSFSSLEFGAKPEDTAGCANSACTQPHSDPGADGQRRADGPSPSDSAQRDDEAIVDALLERIASQSHFEERYEIRELLDQGGMGKIFRAFDKILRRDVAVKMMIYAGSAAVRGQFLKEARVGGRLLHPNVLAVFDLGVDRQANIYYTMRLVDGASLQNCLDAVGKGVSTKLVSYPLRRVVEAMLGVCQGVDFAHQNGVLHLDLKPHNVLVSGFEEVFVIDWGLARVDDVDDSECLADLYRAQTDPDGTGSHTANFGRVAGTPTYMAPEQFDGDIQRFNATTDVYGLGGILHFILYGTSPNRGNHIEQMRRATSLPKPRGKLREGLLPRGQRVRKEVKYALESLENICLKALQPSQQDRYESAEAMVIELTEWLGSTPGPPDGL